MKRILRFLGYKIREIIIALIAYIVLYLTGCGFLWFFELEHEPIDMSIFVAYPILGLATIGGVFVIFVIIFGWFKWNWKKSYREGE